ncbi:hypothetical protein D3C78_1301620 [compost metagenome]
MAMDKQDHAIFDNHTVVSGHEYLFGDYSLGRYAWQLTDMIRLQEPIEVKGKLGLWNYDYEIK